MSERRAPGWSEHALARLQAAGFRRGGARMAVVELLDRQGSALGAHEIEDRLRSERRNR